MDQEKGTLILIPISANIKRNVEKFGEMDPYVKFIIGDEEQ
jgi:hypothetical protein